VEEEGVSYLIKHNETTSWTVVSFLFDLCRNWSVRNTGKWARFCVQHCSLPNPGRSRRRIHAVKYCHPGLYDELSLRRLQWKGFAF